MGWSSLLALCLALATAHAEPRESLAPPGSPTSQATISSRHSLYVEVFGKGGLWGLGYGYQLSKRWALGAVASFWVLDGQRVATASPFVTLFPLGTERHRAFVDLGPQVVRVSTPSPVPEWMGTSSTGVGGELSAGYAYHGPVLVRAFAMLAAGQRGVGPWLGVDVGARF